MNDIPKKIGILGYGQIGKAIASFYHDPYIQDLDGSDFSPGIDLDILHVCIPYSANFHKTVLQVIKEYAPGALVLIHSTVAVGTTKMLWEEHPRIVHAPIRGVHPNLKRGIETFPMYIGSDNPGAASEAAEHMEHLAEEGTIRTVMLHKSATSELLKLLDTTYYGVCIAFHAYAEKLCEKEGVNFDMVMTEANLTYNAGYLELGKRNVNRPVLTPPEGGKIGGHCVIPNAEILEGLYGQDPLLSSILRHK